MVDYVSAFKVGLEAAETAERARKEIDTVFAELNDQISKATDGQISITRQELPIDEWSFVFSHKKRETYWAIVAYNPCVTIDHKKELAKWTQARSGYPCKIVWGDVEFSCEDKKALQNALKILLCDPLVGEHLNTLMQMKPML